MKLHYVVVWSLLSLAGLSGCLKSDAARMAEMRKYAGAGVSDNDEEDAAPVQQQATNYVPPQRSDSTNDANQAGTSATAGQSVTPRAVDSANGSTPSAPAVVGLSDTKSPPETPLSDTERRQVTIDNMNRIATALEAFRQNEKKGGSYPAQFMSDAAGQPLLSWRVRLLPYLGYADLYNQFRHNERWDSAHNQKLIPKIPSVFQSPERFDVYTNYLVPVSGGAAFDGAKPKPIRRWEDGLENAIILAEVDNDQSVIWTEPKDWEFDPRSPKRGLGNLRNDGFFAVWGGGELTLVPRSGGNVRNAFTVDGGDLTSATLKKPAFAAPGGIANAFQRNTSDVGGSTNASLSLNTQGGPSGNHPAAAGGAATPSYVTAINQLDGQTAFNEGREADAIEMFYADALAGNTAAYQQYRWVSGLSRPTPVVRYGIGVEYSGTGANEAKRAAIVALNQAATPGRRGRTNTNGVKQLYEKLTGSFGERILQSLQNQSLFCPFEAIEPEPVVRRRRDDDDALDNEPPRSVAVLAPGIQFIGVDSPRRLLAAAEKHQVDVLVYFQINSRNRSKDVQVSLVDVMRKRKILNTDKLNSRDVSVAKADLLEDDPTLAVLDQIDAFVQQNLSPKSLPPGLKSAAAGKRVVDLSESRVNPLRRLAEVQLYRNLGLIDLRQQSEAFSKILDDDAALALIGGTLDEKLSAIQDYLPREQPVSTSENWRQDGRL